MNKERLLNVARALRESPNPTEFTMAVYGHNCNTPACALGHYAKRHDLQDAFDLDKYGWLTLRDGSPCNYYSAPVLAHFGLTPSESSRLFAGGDDDDGIHAGCGGAKTPIEAAEFIEAFCDEDVDE